MTAPAPLLVVTHEATRSGSTKVLLEVVAMVRREGRPVRVVAEAGGPLLGALQDAAGPVSLAAPPAAVLVNSAVAAASPVIPAGVPVAVYVHEDEEALTGLGPAERDALVAADSVWCVSERMASTLAGLGVAPERLAVVPPVVVAAAPQPDAVAAAVAGLGLPPDRPYVVGCGEVAWHKGPDLFLELACRLAPEGFAAVWLGRRSRAMGRVLDADAAAMGRPDAVRWLGAVDDVVPVLAGAAVLVSTSRRDAQPLVPLEAALAGTPTVGFATTGLLDLADAGGAEVVDYADVEGLAGLVRTVVADGGRSSLLVDAARRRARERQSVDVVGGRVAALVAALAAGGRSA